MSITTWRRSGMLRIDGRRAEGSRRGRGRPAIRSRVRCGIFPIDRLEEFVDELFHFLGALFGERRDDRVAHDAQVEQFFPRSSSFVGSNDVLTLRDGKFGYFGVRFSK